MIGAMHALPLIGRLRSIAEYLRQAFKCHFIKYSRRLQQNVFIRARMCLVLLTTLRRATRVRWPNGGSRELAVVFGGVEW
jgi:hypothetical protein